MVILLGLCWFVSTFWIYERVLRVDLRIALDGVRFDSQLVSRIFPAILSYVEVQQIWNKALGTLSFMVLIKWLWFFKLFRVTSNSFKMLKKGMVIAVPYMIAPLILLLGCAHVATLSSTEPLDSFIQNIRALLFSSPCFMLKSFTNHLWTNGSDVGVGAGVNKDDVGSFFVGDYYAFILCLFFFWISVRMTFIFFVGHFRKIHHGSKKQINLTWLFQKGMSFVSSYFEKKKSQQKQRSYVMPTKPSQKYIFSEIDYQLEEVLYRLNECAKVDKVDDQYEWMIRYSAQNNPDDMNRQQQGGHVTDFNQLTDKFMSDLDFDDSGEYSLSSMATGVSDGTTTSTACFDSSSHCTCCDDENVPSIAHDNEASGDFCDGKQKPNLCPTLNSMQESRLVNAAVTDDNRGGHMLYRRTGANLKAAAATTTADEDFEAILHRYEFKPNKVPFRRFTLDDIADDAGQQSAINAKNTSSARQVVGTFSRPVIVDQLRESEIQFEEEMEKTIRKLQKMERKLKEFDDSDYHTSELSSTIPTPPSPSTGTGAITKVQQHHRQNRTNINNPHPHLDVEEKSFQQSNRVNKKHQFNSKDSINSQQIPYSSSLSSSSTSSPFTMKPNNNNNNVKVEDSDFRRDDNSPSLSFSSLDRLIGGQVGSSTRILGVQQHHHNPNLNISAATCVEYSGKKDNSMLEKTFEQPQLLGGDHLSVVSSSSAAFSSDFNFEGILKTSPSPSPPPQQHQQQQQHANRVKATGRKLPSVTKGTATLDLPRKCYNSGTDNSPNSGAYNNNNNQLEKQQQNMISNVQNLTHQHTQIGENMIINKQPTMTDVSINQAKREHGYHDEFEQSRQMLANLDHLSEEDSRDFVSSKNQSAEKPISTNKPRPRNRATRKKKKRSPRQPLSADVNLGYEAEIEEAEDTV